MKKSSLTVRQEEFIGTQFPTPKGGVLTVTGIGNKTKSGMIRFVLECTICSLDADLWPTNSIQATKSSLKNGIPCGCTTGRVSWSKIQYESKVSGLCKERGYNFLGFCNWNGKLTKIKLHNPVTGNTWQSTSIDNFLNKNIEDPALRTDKLRRVNRVQDINHIKDFIDAGFTKEYTFTRSTKKDATGRTQYWTVICPKCSNDEYVNKGLCEGKFESSTSNLKAGKMPCRCGKNFLWTQEQQTYKVKNTINSIGGVFIGWSEEKIGYKNNRSNFKWKCNLGHECEASVANFLHHNTRCITCFNEKQRLAGFCNGYYPHRLDEIDHLYVIDFGKCIKVGRAFDVETRIGKSKSKGLIKQSGRTRDQLKVLKILTGIHREIYSLEQDMHEELRVRGFEYTNETWSTELFTSDSKDIIFMLCNQSGLQELR